MEEEKDIDDDEDKMNLEGLVAFFKKNYYQIVAVGMLIMALSGMWFCYKLGFTHGAVTICKNSYGTPLLKNSDNIKDGQCLVKYDNFGVFGEVKNNLGLSDEDVIRFEKGLDKKQ